MQRYPQRTPSRAITVVSVVPERRAIIVGRSSCSSGIVARVELITTPAVSPEDSSKIFVFLHDAQASERRDDIDAIFARRLAHVGNQSFLGFKRNAFFQAPTQHWNCFRCGARKNIEVQNENANDFVGNQQSNRLILARRFAEKLFHSLYEPRQTSIRFVSTAEGLTDPAGISATAKSLRPNVPRLQWAAAT